MTSQTKHQLFIITGMPAVGKTVFARQLAKTRNACIVDIDTTTEPVIRAAMREISGDSDDRDSPIFKRVFREAIYETLFAIAEDNLAHSDVVITGPFTKELGDPHWLETLSQQLSIEADIQCLYLYCDPALRKQRLIDRANPRDSSKLENWDEHEAYYGTGKRPTCPHTPIATDDQSATRELLSSLANKNARPQDGEA